MKAAPIKPTSEELVERLIACERDELGVESMPAFRICEKLRDPLSTLVGSLGYRALITRALTLAQRESNLLVSVRVKDDGALEYPNSEAFSTASVLPTQLIALLLSFVGEAVTLRLVHDVWPNLRGSEDTLGESDDSRR
jgi:hypothetical protein